MLELEPLRAETFILRELKPSDKEELFSILNNPDIYKYIPGLYLRSFDDISHIFFLANLNRNIFLVIEDISSKKIIGMIFAYITKDNYAKISYLMIESERGRGIMPEALKLFIRYLYIKRLVTTIHFDININNLSSIRVIQKLNIPVYFNEEEECLKSYLSLTKELPF